MALSSSDWNDVVVAREGMVTTLVCTDRTVRGAVSIKWKVKSHGADEWKLILSASEKKTSYYSVTEESMRQTDLNFREGVFSLVFFPKMEDGGLYSCLIEQQERNMKKMKIILLAILTGRKIITLYVRFLPNYPLRSIYLSSLVIN